MNFSGSKCQCRQQLLHPLDPRPLLSLCSPYTLTLRSASFPFYLQYHQQRPPGALCSLPSSRTVARSFKIWLVVEGWWAKLSRSWYFLINSSSIRQNSSSGIRWWVGGVCRNTRLLLWWDAYLSLQNSSDLTESVCKHTISLALGEGHTKLKPRMDVKCIRKFANTQAKEHKRQIKTILTCVSKSLN